VNHRRLSLVLALPVAALAALATGSRASSPPPHVAGFDAGAAITAQEPEKPAKPRKKKVKATLVEPEESAPPVENAAPSPAPVPATTSTAPASSTGNRVAEPAPTAARTPAEPAPTASARSAAPPAAASADEPPPRAPGVSETVTVREVQLDVLVTDGRGDPVLGLGPSDFVVEEDGEQREITSVTFYGGLPELRAEGAQGTERRTDRYFILLFHDQAQAAPSLMAAQLDAARWTKKWLETLEPNDQVAVLGYDVRLKVYEDFTRDRERVAEAVENAAVGRKEPDRWREEERPVATVDSPSLLVNLPTGRTLSRQTRKLEQALEVIGQAAEGVVGRKNLILFSVGYGDIDDFGFFTPDPRYYPDMEQALNTGNVAVYAIDTLGSSRSDPGARRENDSLSSIATDTGGHYYSIFTNVATPLREVANDNLGYYLISYRSDFPTGTSGYREVEVRTTNGQWNVRAREGYRYGEVED
jgi:VWFA-related protein